MAKNWENEKKALKKVVRMVLEKIFQYQPKFGFTKAPLGKNRPGIDMIDLGSW